jgi:predicted metal-dependent enzyme (double-stranded beta helix superfamily)
MFDLDSFLADSVAARRETDAIVAIKEVLERALADPSEVSEALPAVAAEFSPLYTSSEISILKFVWGPAMTIPPHDHLMWAVIGIYGGEEDNVFYRRTPDGIVHAGGRRVGAAQTALLGTDVIHAVTNPNPRGCTGSIHIYGGDYLHKRRSVWNPDTLEERPADGETIRRMFDEARAQATF